MTNLDYQNNLFFDTESRDLYNYHSQVLEREAAIVNVLILIYLENI
jgi:hypothetical protein